jgi:hypothetical protein
MTFQSVLGDNGNLAMEQIAESGSTLPVWKGTLKQNRIQERGM